MSLSINFWVGLDVHKDTVTVAVFRNRDPEPLHVDRLPYDLRKIRRYFQRLQIEGTVRACYEASGAGCVLRRSLHPGPGEASKLTLLVDQSLGQEPGALN